MMQRKENSMVNQPKYPKIVVKPVGEDDNVFAIIGRVQRALRDAGVKTEDVIAFRDETMASKDYNGVLQTCIRWVTVQ
jgi:hypothetical protein